MWVGQALTTGGVVGLQTDNANANRKTHLELRGDGGADEGDLLSFYLFGWLVSPREKQEGGGGGKTGPMECLIETVTLLSI